MENYNKEVLKDKDKETKNNTKSDTKQNKKSVYLWRIRLEPGKNTFSFYFTLIHIFTLYTYNF